MFFTDPTTTSHAHPHHPPYILNPLMFQPDYQTLVQLGHPPVATAHLHTDRTLQPYNPFSRL